MTLCAENMNDTLTSLKSTNFCRYSNLPINTTPVYYEFPAKLHPTPFITTPPIITDARVSTSLMLHRGP